MAQQQQKARIKRNIGVFPIGHMYDGELVVEDGRLWLITQDNHYTECQVVKNQDLTKEIRIIPKEIQGSFVSERQKMCEKAERILKETAYIQGEYGIGPSVNEIITKKEFWKRIDESEDFRNEVSGHVHNKSSYYWKDGDKEITHEEAHDIVLKSWKKEGIDNVTGCNVRQDGMVERHRGWGELYYVEPFDKNRINYGYWKDEQ